MILCRNFEGRGLTFINAPFKKYAYSVIARVFGKE
jgi:hypothetical protein